MNLYIDGTSGGMILQVLLSGFVGSFVFIKLFWRNVLNMFVRSSEEPDPAATDEARSDAATPVS